MTMARLIDADVIVRIADIGTQKYQSRYVTWEKLKYLVSKCPTVNAVEIPDCSKCIYNERIENWHQCDHCIGNTHGNNNFVSIEEDDNGN